ncbi:ATP-binding response regulator [Limnohabitans radicicola]|uniref:histidine kinase n=1 Tax=Limnohabitans radicicola TaxID=2771427 RepID=A0A927IMI7_9BURK|nr:hybrid sensor histidine kinase/response regulator [Limnohabitans radicicola]MBD8051231.1 response regulator [Limnohabitans radicicola]
MMETRHPQLKQNFNELVAIEKLQHMHNYSKSSTVATILAPLLCIPLYEDSTPHLPFYVWLVAMAIAVMARYCLLKLIRAKDKPQRDFVFLNIAIGMVTFVWGIGWFVFVQPSDMVSYLLYQIISLTVLFVGMVGYCIDWKTFAAFVIPLKLPELVFITLNFSQIVWPIALGSMVAFYLALKMGFLFASSWEKSFSLRLRNDALFDQLIEEKNASMAANIAKSEFIATASHDLRQPMQSINIFLDMVDPSELKDKHSSIFLRMRKSVSVLNRMFNTLLDISKLDSNFAVNERPFHLTEIVNILEDRFSDLCAEKNIQLSFVDGNFVVQGDANLLEQILRNLLANAIQYTDKGAISVAFHGQSGTLGFTVEDSGCGIPAEDLPLIFKEFFRSDHSRSHYDGLGLGLSIVSRIVKKINGTCTVQSEVGQGSTFTIQTSFPVLERSDALQSRTHNSDTRNTIHRYEQTRPATQSIHLGIIENDDALLTAYQQYFTRSGYNVHVIPHSQADFEAHLASMPKLDFILSDFRLGEHDGIHFIQRLREEFNHDIPACIVTADTSPQHLELFSRHNIEVMYKPIDIKSVEAFIATRIH